MCASSKVVRLKSDPITIQSFGTATAMNFDDYSGSVEILMTFPEVRKILAAFHEYETTKPEPNEEIITAIDRLTEAFYGTDIKIIADVPIAQRKVLFRPAVMEEEYEYLFRPPEEK